MAQADDETESDIAAAALVDNGAQQLHTRRSQRGQLPRHERTLPMQHAQRTRHAHAHTRR